MSLEQLKYPIGKFDAPANIGKAELDQYKKDIAALPEQISAAVKGLTDEQLAVPYREGGWNSRQVVNHLSDSHMHALIRFKWALTEDSPTIKPYHEALWAELHDSRQMPVDSALIILKGVHERWANLMSSLDEAQWKRSFVHPEKGRAISLKESAGSYAWHGRHHLAHITNLKQRMLW